VSERVNHMASRPFSGASVEQIEAELSVRKSELEASAASEQLKLFENEIIRSATDVTNDVVRKRASIVTRITKLQAANFKARAKAARLGLSDDFPLVHGKKL
jgi:hypothetical protein